MQPFFSFNKTVLYPCIHNSPSIPYSKFTTMRTSILCVLILCTIQSIYGQTPCTGLDTIDYPRFREILHNQFTKLITGQTNAQPGNFAAVDLEKTEVSFNGSQVFTNGAVASLNASGGVSDGAFSLFSNSKLSSNIGLEFKYSFLNSYQNHMLGFSCKELQQFQKDTSDLALYYRTHLDMMRKDLVLKSAQRKSLLQENQRIQDMLDSAKNPVFIKELQFKKGQNELLIDSLNLLIQITYKGGDEKAFAEALNKERVQKVKDAKQTINIHAFDIAWFAVGYKVVSKGFSVFDSAKQFKDQVQKKEYVSHQVSIEYNHYKWDKIPYHTTYLLLGVIANVDDNKDDLESLELNDVTNYTSLNGIRSSSDKYTVYTGDYKQRLFGMRLYGDYYKFLFNNNIAAAHLYAEGRFKNALKPEYNFGLGFLYNFSNVKDEKSVINTELFYTFLDVFNGTLSKKSFSERNTIGIRFSFPINF